LTDDGHTNESHNSQAHVPVYSLGMFNYLLIYLFLLKNAFHSKPD